MTSINKMAILAILQLSLLRLPAIASYSYSSTGL